MIKWLSKVTKILHSEYEDAKGFTDWFNICYQNEEGHNMVQSLKLQSFDGEVYYDLDGYASQPASGRYPDGSGRRLLPACHCVLQ